MTFQDVDPGQAQEAARRILSERRFRTPDLPRPFEGALDALGRLLRRVFEPLVDFLDDLLPGPTAVVWTVLALVVLGAALLVASIVSRRRTVPLAAGGVRLAAAGGDDPRALEATADEAERSGDYDEAVRLRYRAGLLRLDAAGRIEWTESTTSREVARKLRSARFDHLTQVFDQVVYGGRAATAGDARTARTEWTALLGGTARGEAA